jgi:hypothetical protein
MVGDATFSVLGTSGDAYDVAYVTASNVRVAIVGLKVATGLACIDWIAFGVTIVLSSKISFAHPILSISKPCGFCLLHTLRSDTFVCD